MSEQVLEISNRLKEVRITLKKTQSEIANIIGYKQNTISENESGQEKLLKKGIAIRYIQIFCDRLNINRDWLLTGEGEMFLESTNEKKTDPNLNMNDSRLIEHLERTITAQEKLIASLESENARLRADNDTLRSDNQTLREQIIQSATGNKSQQAG